MARKVCKIVVVDDRPGMGLAASLAALSNVKICAEAGTAAEAVEAVESIAPEIVIVDLSLPRSGGLALVRALTRLHGESIVVAVAVEGSRQRAAAVLKAGARAFLLRDGAGKMFPKALAAIDAGRPYVDPRIEPERRILRPRRRQPTTA